jgi:DNA-binding NtrC family response regulator
MTHSQRGTVLVVDDCPENMQVLIAALQACGVTIVVAAQGEAALEMAVQILPDLLLLDVRKPHMQGLDTFRRIRANQATHEIPIIVMTSPAEMADASEITDVAEGCEVASVDFLTTPFQAKEVIARVTAHLTIRTLKRQLSAQRCQRDLNFREAIEAYEKSLIVRALEHHHGNMAHTAESLTIPLRTLYRKIKRYRLS